MKLGIIYKDGRIVNHRSLIKVLLNPILRYFGYEIATTFKDGKLGGVILQKCPKVDVIKWEKYILENSIVVKKRIIY